MKKFVSLILVLLLFLSGCRLQPPAVTTTQLTATQPTTTVSPTNSEPVFIVDFAEFDRWLERESMVPGMTRDEFAQIVENYSYNGTKVVDLNSAVLNDDTFSLTHHDDLYAFYCVKDRHFNVANRGGYSYDTIRTKVPLEGLSMSFGIQFGDSLGDVVGKLMDNVNPYIAIPDGMTEKILYKEGTKTLTLLITDSGYELRYRNWSYRVIPLVNGGYGISNHMQQVVMRFSAGGYALEELELHIYQYH